HASRVYQINNREVVFECNFLCTKVFLARDREPCSGFDGSIVRHNHTQAPTDIAQYDDNPAIRASAMLRMHSISSKSPHFGVRSSLIQHIENTLPSRHLLLGFVLIYFVHTASKQ